MKKERERRKKESLHPQYKKNLSRKLFADGKLWSSRKLFADAKLVICGPILILTLTDNHHAFP
jgi:hypothetical protein